MTGFWVVLFFLHLQLLYQTRAGLCEAAEAPA